MARISRIKRLKAREVTSGSTAHLVDDMVDIVQDYFAGPDREMIARRVICRDPDSDLVLFYDRAGTLLGFLAHAITRHEVDGSHYNVLDGGIYLAPGARGVGLWATLYVLLAGLAFKVRNPKEPMCLVGVATNPASYRLVAGSFPVLHPSRDTETPDHITALVRDVLQQKNFLFVDDDPWRVHVGIPVRLRQQERMKRFIERADDPNVNFFVQRNPGFIEGHWLSVYIPLDSRNFLGGVAGIAMGIVRRVLSGRLSGRR